MKKIILLFLPILFLSTFVGAEDTHVETSEKALIEKEVAATINTDIARKPPIKKTVISLDLKQVFAASPLIYSALFIMSVASVVIWLYSLLTFRSKDIMPSSFVKDAQDILVSKDYEKALQLCDTHNNLLSNILASGILAKDYGQQVMVDSMKSEGRRSSTSFWQRLSLLNDVVIIAPMLGLLGTVIGMFYAFYDVNRSVESITALFDGLGIAVGTTVMGLIVAIVAMVFSTTLKYRLVKTLSLVENEALALSSLIETKE